MDRDIRGESGHRLTFSLPTGTLTKTTRRSCVARNWKKWLVSPNITFPSNTRETKPSMSRRESILSCNIKSPPFSTSSPPANRRRWVDWISHSTVQYCTLPYFTVLYSSDSNDVVITSGCCYIGCFNITRYFPSLLMFRLLDLTCSLG